MQKEKKKKKRDKEKKRKEKKRRRRRREKKKKRKKKDIMQQGKRKVERRTGNGLERQTRPIAGRASAHQKGGSFWSSSRIRNWPQFPQRNLDGQGVGKRSRSIGKGCVYYHGHRLRCDKLDIDTSCGF